MCSRSLFTDHNLFVQAAEHKRHTEGKVMAHGRWKDDIIRLFRRQPLTSPFLLECTVRRLHGRRRHRGLQHLRREVQGRELPAQAHGARVAVDGKRRPQHQRLSGASVVCVGLFPVDVRTGQGTVAPQSMAYHVGDIASLEESLCVQVDERVFSIIRTVHSSSCDVRNLSIDLRLR